MTTVAEPGLKLVPFNAAWINHDKIDVHAIYRRPRFTEDAYGEPHREYDAVTGLPTWDLTGPLPVKQHNKWLAKGFEYVTLASRSDLYMAGTNNTVDGWRQYDQHRVGGPWNYKLYASGQISDQTRAAAQLVADVETYGSAAVLAIRRQQEPDFDLPAHLQGRMPQAQRALAEPSADQAQGPKKGAGGRFVSASERSDAGGATSGSGE